MCHRYVREFNWDSSVKGPLVFSIKKRKNSSYSSWESSEIAWEVGSVTEISQQCFSSLHWEDIPMWPWGLWSLVSWLSNSKIHSMMKQPRGCCANSIDSINAHVQFLKLELYTFSIMFIIEFSLGKLNGNRRHGKHYSIQLHNSGKDINTCQKYYPTINEQMM